MSPESLTKWRVIPRICLVLFILLCYNVVNWFMGLDAPSMEQAGFVSTIFLTLPAVFKFYVESGNKDGSE